ncbi:MAG TPA: co-chaperone GroES [Candidatus Krumholzibacteria bacterium]|nr:co-chaperone GroES [Candidatus Krumholzibacteria bacterium]
MKMIPIGDRVIVRLLEKEETKKGGIIIPDTAKERPQEGEVVAVGKGRRANNGERMELEVKKGDRVLFAKYAGNEIKIEDDKYLVMKEDEILAIL